MHIEEHVAIKAFTTFKIGGEARFFCRAKSADDVLEAVIFARKQNVSWMILGGGSNVLVSDDGFDGLVIKMELMGIEKVEQADGRTEISVGAGENWDGFVAWTVKQKLYGLENLSGIPGTVGGAPVQNIGAYGVEVSEVISWVEVFDTKELKIKTLKPEECDFSYRYSIFKTPKGRHFIITKVGFVLSKKGKLKLEYKDLAQYFGAAATAAPTLPAVRKAVIEIRARKFPNLKTHGTAGSFFKNPILSKKDFQALSLMYPNLPSFPQSYGRVKVPLGWILEHVCELKGTRVGSVGSFQNQALVIVNYENATAREVSDFVHEIAQQVKQKTGITIEWEVQYVE